MDSLRLNVVTGELGKESLDELLLGELAQVNLAGGLRLGLDGLDNNLRNRHGSRNLELWVEVLLLLRLLDGDHFGGLRLDELVVVLRLGRNVLLNNSWGRVVREEVLIGGLEGLLGLGNLEEGAD